MQKLSFFNLVFLLLISVNTGFSQIPVRIDVNLTKDRKAISPLIYGKNNVLSNAVGNPVSSEDIQKIKEAGIRLVRQGGGNNSTKYNWRNKLTSHPDWYNNVYSADWDYAASSMLEKLPGMQGMWSFQLLGKAAANNKNNFNDWDFNQSKWWDGVNQNLAGNGQPDLAGGGKALVEGNPNLYLMDWPADSTVGILDKWFGPQGLGYEKSSIRYWSMDNEPEIWSATHDDVMKTQCTAEEYMQLYFKVAKAARAKFPEIKLIGPVPANEWQWYNWSGGSIINGKKYPWLEFFIKRIAEEEKVSGIKLLDVLDIHFYPQTSDDAQSVQLHRVYFDRTFAFPEANGIKSINGGWDTSLNKEYILGRCADWLTNYMGVDNKVGLSVTETAIASKNPNVQAVWYASTLGEFMKNGVEIFTPWSWEVGMWETIHLFSRYNQGNYVEAVSQNESLISAYPSVNNSTDSISIILVNRSLTDKNLVNLNFNGSIVGDGKYTMMSLSNLKSTETFVSHTNNALVRSDVTAKNNQINVELAPLSVNAIVLTSLTTSVKHSLKINSFKAAIYPNPAIDWCYLNISLSKEEKLNIGLYQVNGMLRKSICNKVFEPGSQTIGIEINDLPSGVYFIKFQSKDDQETIKLIKKQM